MLGCSFFFVKKEIEKNLEIIEDFFLAFFMKSTIEKGIKYISVINKSGIKSRYEPVVESNLSESLVVRKPAIPPE